MRSEEVYLSVKVPTYKHSKSQLLECQINLLNSLKRMHNLRVLARQKHDLKKEFSCLLVQLKEKLVEIGDSIPKPEVPDVIKEKEIKKEKKTSKAKKDSEEKAEKKKKKEKNFSRRANIDAELHRIQAKLKSL